MPLLRDEDVAQLSGIFSSALTADVTLVHYTQQESKLIVPGAAKCASCTDTEQLLDELAGTSTHLTVEKHDFAAELETAEANGIDKIPATIVKGASGDERVRYFGIPAGYEFAALIEDIIDVGSGESGLSTKTLAALATLDQKVHIQVFTTPT